VLDVIWPTFALRLVTPRLELRLPSDNDIAALARLAGQGVHEPSERPFLTPWTQDGPDATAEAVLRGQGGRLSQWSPQDWSLGLGVFSPGGEPLGLVTLRARAFPVVREVTTSSWLGLAHHGRGLETEARRAVLTLAFEHLGAAAARTEVFPDNHASQGVSSKLGYEPDGISRDARGEEVLVSDRLRLTRLAWQGTAAGSVDTG
jgi:RimJ/RimL family protein N-acetyltransferase